MKPIIYLSGPIKGLRYHGAIEWRDAAKKELKQCGMAVLCPMRAKEIWNDGRIIGNVEVQSSEAIHLTPKAVVTRDNDDVRNCHAMLVNLLGAQTISVGTIFEIAWAYELKKPIFLVMEASGNPHEHAFIRECCGFQGTNLEEVMAVLMATYAPYVTNETINEK